MASHEIGKFFEILAEDAIKAGRDAAGKVETFTRDTVKAVTENAARHKVVDANAEKKILDAAKKTGEDTLKQVQRDSRGRVIPDGVERLPSGKLPANWEYAGKTFDGDTWTPKLASKYPNGVRFTEDGYPDFSPYATHTVTFDPNFKGDRSTDFTAANRMAGLSETPEGYTWHHTQDTKTMQLIPTDLHNAVRHAGGVAIMKGRP
jgi:hypothetical protein